MRSSFRQMACFCLAFTFQPNEVVWAGESIFTTQALANVPPAFSRKNKASKPRVAVLRWTTSIAAMTVRRDRTGGAEWYALMAHPEYAQPGARVRHSVFLEGTIENIYETTLVILFDKHGQKKLPLNAPLQVRVPKLAESISHTPFRDKDEHPRRKKLGFSETQWGQWNEMKGDSQEVVIKTNPISKRTI